jgi:transcriptional regulator with XRE-family HTH domain
VAAADPTSTLLAYLGANVRRLRARRALTQEALAELADIDVRYVQRIERGAVNLRFRSFAKLATALEVPPAALLRPAALKPIKVGRPRRK